MSRNEQLIDRLVGDLEPVPRPPATGGVWLAWMLVSVLFVLGATHLAGPIRPVAMLQLETVPRFALEMLVGAGAAICLALAAFRAAIPGQLSRPLLWGGLGLAMLWLGNFLVGLAYPTLEPSMLGKRDLCVMETLLYGLPPLIALLYWQQRQFVLSTLRAGMLAGLAAGIIPALYMQIACMYEPTHILMFHVAPAIVLMMIAPVLLAFWQRRRAGARPDAGRDSSRK